MKTRDEQNEEIAKYIFEIDWLTTTEFCKQFGYPVPTYNSAKSPKQMADEFLLTDAFKYHKIKDFAKQMRKDNTPNED